MTISSIYDAPPRFPEVWASDWGEDFCQTNKDKKEVNWYFRKNFNKRKNKGN